MLKKDPMFQERIAQENSSVPSLERGDILIEIDLKAVRDTVQLPDAVYDRQSSDAPGQCQCYIDKGNDQEPNWIQHPAQDTRQKMNTITKGDIEYNRHKQTTGPRQANLVLIVYTSSEGSGEPAYPRRLARTSAARSYQQ